MIGKRLTPKQLIQTLRLCLLVLPHGPRLCLRGHHRERVKVTAMKITDLQMIHRQSMYSQHGSQKHIYPHTNNHTNTRKRTSAESKHESIHMQASGRRLSIESRRISHENKHDSSSDDNRGYSKHDELYRQPIIFRDQLDHQKSIMYKVELYYMWILNIWWLLGFFHSEDFVLTLADDRWRFDRSVGWVQFRRHCSQVQIQTARAAALPLPLGPWPTTWDQIQPKFVYSTTKTAKATAQGINSSYCNRPTSSMYDLSQHFYNIFR